MKIAWPSLTTSSPSLMALRRKIPHLTAWQVLSVPAEPTLVTLASDGYPQLKSSLAETENYLQQVLASDPLMITQHPKTKGRQADQASFDDRSFIQFESDSTEGKQRLT